MFLSIKVRPVSQAVMEGFAKEKVLSHIAGYRMTKKTSSREEEAARYTI